MCINLNISTGVLNNTTLVNYKILSNMIFKAIEFAARAHAGQYRKGTDLPYICHPMNVCQILVGYKCSKEMVIAGILHDVLEDTSMTKADLEQNFGKEITDLVVGASEPEQMQGNWFNAFNWGKRKTNTLDKLGKSATGDILMVSIADKLDNIRSIKRDYRELGEKVWLRFNAGRAQQEWYYTSLARVFRARAVKEGPGFRALSEIFENEVQECFNISA